MDENVKYQYIQNVSSPIKSVAVMLFLSLKLFFPLNLLVSLLHFYFHFLLTWHVTLFSSSLSAGLKDFFSLVVWKQTK